MTYNPLKDIEDKKGNEDMGAMATQMYKGSRREGASHKQALDIVAAFAKGMFAAAQEINAKEEEVEDDD